MRPPEESRREFVIEWLGKASEDLGAAERLLDDSTSYPNVIAFHCQQAAEKCLKAFLTRHEVAFPKTHDIEELLDLMARVEAGLAAELREGTALTPYAVQARYPSDLPRAGPDDANRAVVLARIVYDRVLAALEDYLRAKPQP